MKNKQLNIYLVNKKTRRIYYNNIEWGESGRFSEGKIRALEIRSGFFDSESPYSERLFNEIEINVNDCHVIFGRELEIISKNKEITGSMDRLWASAGFLMEDYLLDENRTGINGLDMQWITFHYEKEAKCNIHTMK